MKATLEKRRPNIGVVTVCFHKTCDVYKNASKCTTAFS